MLVALLVFPVPADAAPIVPPVGDVVGGYTLEATDTWTSLGTRGSNMSLPADVANGVVRTPAGALQWGSDGCSSVDLPWGPQVAGNCDLVPGTIATWRATRSHPFRKTPWLDVTVQRFYATSSSEVITTRAADQIAVHEDLNTPDCNPTGDNAAWFVVDGAVSMTPNALAPADFHAACAPTNPTVDSTTNPTVNPTTNPTTAARCAPLAYQRRRVAVTARGASCTTGRNIMAAYLRRGVEPRGWVCVTARQGRSRAASCARVGRARSGPRVSGTWRA